MTPLARELFEHLSQTLLEFVENRADELMVLWDYGDTAHVVGSWSEAIILATPGLTAGVEFRPWRDPVPVFVAPTAHEVAAGLVESLAVELLPRKRWRKAEASAEDRAEFDKRWTMDVETRISGRAWGQLAARLRVERAHVLKVDPPPPVTDDDSAYVPAGDLRATRLEQFPRAEQLTRYLETLNRDRVVIRTRKPSRNRLKIHSGDWHSHFSQLDEQQAEAVDPDAVANLLADQAARTAEARGRKRRET